MADALVKSFCEMLIPAVRLTTEEKKKEFQDSLIKVLRLRTIKMDPREDSIRIFLKKVYNEVEAVGANTYTSTGKKGTYGEVFSIAGKDTIVKRINFFQGSDVESYRNFFAILKELFIQYILSSDPELGMHVPKLFSVKRAGTHMVLVEMERADYTLLDWLRDLKAHDGVLQYAKVRPKIKDILGILIKFHNKYEFTHRDFKLDNVMYAGTTVKIIDFGMSCIKINFGGEPVKIINDVYYTGTSTCKIEQDIGLFLFNFLFTFGGDLDADFAKFMKNTHITNFKTRLEGLNSKLQLFHRAYNANGSLFGAPPISDYFKPDDIMLLLGVLKLNTPAMSALITRPQTRIDPYKGLSVRRSSRIASRKSKLPTANQTRKASVIKPWQRIKV